MTSIAAITAAAETVTCDGNGHAKHVFNISNTTGQPIHVGTQVLVDAPLEGQWLSIEGPAERDLAEKGADQVTVAIQVPTGTAPGKYRFRLLVFSGAAPGEDFTEGPTVAFQVRQAFPEEAPKAQKRPRWWIAAIVVGVLLAGGLLTWAMWPEGAKTIEVPDLVARPIEPAKKALDDLGLRGEVIGTQPTAQQPPNTVWDQDPKAGERVEAGSTVEFIVTVKPAVPSVTEDCLGLDPGKLRIQQDGGRWLLTDARSRMKLFPNRGEADAALATIRHYRMNDHCFVGRPDPSMEYWLVSNQAPTGARSGEDCIAFALTRLRVVDESGRWLMTDGGSRMRVFPNQQEAEQALEIIRKYGFNRTCYIGRPDPSMTYFRK
jgi:hypothetical protein